MFRCKHRWKELYKFNVESEFGWVKTILVCTCMNCGKIKKITIK